MRTITCEASQFVKIGLVVAGLTLTACSGAEQKVPKDDLQQALVNVAIPEMERQGTAAALDAVNNYRSKDSLPFTIENYDCKDVATDTYDCTGKLAMANPGAGPSSMDFKGRVLWKDGKLGLVGPTAFNDMVVNP